MLNDEQKEAVGHKGEPLLIIAGAGTGKTTVVTERIKFLIKKELATPQEILALTFTEKAAREMEERVDKALPYGYTQTWISTFHSFCDRVLRNEALNIGLNSAFRLIGEAESSQLLQKHIWDIDLAYFRPRGNPTKFIGALLTHFNRLKDEDVSPKEYRQFVKRTTREKQEIEKLQELVSTYKKYEELKVKEGVMDFADLITNTLALFRRRKNILRDYQKRFKYILVDEFQDTNIAQYELIRLLTLRGKSPHLTVVGDDSQSIYKFRGAAVSNILSFMQDYPTAKQIVLTKNYRSTQTILNHAYKLIKHNDPDTLEAKLGIDKNLVSTRKTAQQQPLELIFRERVEDEADAVVEKIEELAKKGNLRWRDFAILARANNHSEPFLQALKRRGVPFQFLGPGQLFRQEEVRDLIAYIKTLAHFDDSASFYRVLAMDIWDISGRDLSALNTTTKRANLSLFEVCEEIVKKVRKQEYERRLDDTQLPFLANKTIAALDKIVGIIHRHLKLVPKESAGQLLYYFLQDSGLLPQLVGEAKSVKEEKRINNIASFFDKLKNYEADHEDASVFAVADWIELSMELGESPLASDIDWTEEDRVNILTVHSAKGLEFPVVFLVNLVNHRFPSINRREQIPLPEELIRESLPEGDFHEQEERRLFYVGMTRARDYLYYSASKFYGEGKRERAISGFVKEALGEEYLDNQIQSQEQAQLDLFGAWRKTDEEREEDKRKHTVSFLSYSQIQTFKFCPLHYKLRYILKVPTPVSSAQTFGTNIHNTLKDYYLYLQGQHEQKKLAWNKNLLAKTLRRNWQSIGFRNKNEEKQHYRSAQKYLNDYYEKHAQKPFRARAVEEKFVFPLTKYLKVGGIIDRIDLHPNGKIEIVDYKTSEKVPSQKDVDGDSQLTIYALAAAEVRHPLLLKQPEEILLSLYFFESQIKITTMRTSQQLIAAKEEIIDIAHQIEESDFACSGNIYCKKCEYRLYCNAA